MGGSQIKYSRFNETNKEGETPLLHSVLLDEGQDPKTYETDSEFTTVRDLFE